MEAPRPVPSTGESVQKIDSRKAAGVACLAFLAAILFLVVKNVDRASAKEVTSTLSRNIEVIQAPGTIAYLPAIYRPVTAPVVIIEFTCEQESGWVHCYGVVENVSDKKISDVKIRINLNGRPQTYTYPGVNTILPGTTANFDNWIDYSTTLSNYFASIVSWFEE